MSDKMRGPVSNVVYVFAGDKIVAKFSADTATENAKNPMQQAKLFLSEISNNKEHEHFMNLQDGKMFYVSGHPKKITLETKETLSM